MSYERTDEDRKLVSGHEVPAPQLLRRSLAALLRLEDLAHDLLAELRAARPEAPKRKGGA